MFNYFKMFCPVCILNALYASMASHSIYLYTKEFIVNYLIIVSSYLFNYIKLDFINKMNVRHAGKVLYERKCKTSPSHLK